MSKKFELLILPNGQKPFRVWADSLSISTQAKVISHIHRIAHGKRKKSVRPLSDGIFEININLESDYRVYFGESNGSLILLLASGTQGSQSSDIKFAKKYWRDYEQLLR